MTKDQIIALAEKAGIVVIGEAVWRLCELVAAAEREACAQVCDDRSGTRATARHCADKIRDRGEA